MDNTATIIFPHQLFEPSADRLHGTVILVEEELFFTQYRFHKQKIAYHRASMKWHEAELRSSGYRTQYINSGDDDDRISNIVETLAGYGIRTIHITDPVDDWLMQRITSAARQHRVKLVVHESPMFLNNMDQNREILGDGSSFNQTSFYINQRKRLNILLDDGKPAGGKWSFDSENRKKYPAGKTPPEVNTPDADEFYKEAVAYVNEFFQDNPGTIGESPLFPHTRDGAQKWLNEFLRHRFNDFGAYEDAMVEGQLILHHSVLTPMLNTGLLTPQQVIDEAVSFCMEHEIPLNSQEGFIRQIIGWREFIRAVYELRGHNQRTNNFWGFKRKIPSSFYTGDTGIVPVDNVIKKVLRTGYCHHIERLMVLGNFMLLCEFDPDEVYQWFMELFIDAYDWVMVPNVYGMSQFADGGLMSTKPYISGSNYIMKMSDYKKGEWQTVWDGLYWRFIHTHREFFNSNPRTGMAVRTFDKMNEERKKKVLGAAEKFLEGL